MANGIITIIVGLGVWFVLPILFNDALRRRSHKKAVAMLCKIVGIVLIVLAVADLISILI